MPVILTKPDEIEEWMTAPTKEALRLQRPLRDGALRIVARGEKLELPSPASSKPISHLLESAITRPRGRGCRQTAVGSSPRMRGTQLQSVLIAGAPGSSPRMRGTPRNLARDVANQRFIPAHAGNTTRAPAKSVSGGSSPRMRGTQRGASARSP